MALGPEVPGGLFERKKDIILLNLRGPRYRLDISKMLWAHHFVGPPLQWALHFIGLPGQGAHNFKSPSLYGATTQTAHFLC